MNTSAKLGGQNPQFDAFLVAAVGEDRNGTLVSVMSALARFGVDPWKEAEVLADLSQAAAADRLDKVILALADVPSASADHQSIVTRLITLLPQTRTIQATVRKAAGPMAPEQGWEAVLWVGVMVIFLLGQMMAPQPDAAASGGDMSTTLTRQGNLTP